MSEPAIDDIPAQLYSAYAAAKRDLAVIDAHPEAHPALLRTMMHEAFDRVTAELVAKGYLAEERAIE